MRLIFASKLQIYYMIHIFADNISVEIISKIFDNT